MAAWQGKSKGSPAGYRIFVWILRTFGLRPAYLLLRFVAFYYLLSSWKTSRAIFQFYRRGLGKSRLAATILIYRNYCRLGQTLIDKVAVLAGLGARFSSRSEGIEHLEAMAQGGRGGILLSAHMGNWEVAGHFLQKLDRKINLVMYDGEHQAIKQYLDSVVGEKSFRVIVIRPDHRHVYEIAAALAANELICMHADRYVAGSKTILHPFLGHPAPFPEGPFVLGTKMRVPVCFVFALKESDYGYSFCAKTPAAVQAGIDGPRHLLAEFVEELEKNVRKHPEQWFNYYPFWQTN